MASAIEDEILYGRDHDRVRIFVSSKMDGSLDEERSKTATAIDRLDTHKAWWWEQDAPAGVLHSEAECVKFARTSDGLILLIAGPLSAIIQAEYNAAKDAQAARYIFIRDTAELPEDVLSFIQTERGEVVTRNFQNTAELDTIVYTTLRRTLVRAAREVQIGRRRGRVS